MSGDNIATKMLAISEDVKDRLDEIKVQAGDISYNEVLLTLLEKPNLMSVWNSHMLALVLLMRTYGTKGLPEDPQPERDAALDILKQSTAAFRKAMGY